MLSPFYYVTVNDKIFIILLSHSLKCSKKNTRSRKLFTSTFKTSCHKVSLKGKRTVYLRKSGADKVRKKNGSDVKF